MGAQRESDIIEENLHSLIFLIFVETHHTAELVFLWRRECLGSFDLEHPYLDVLLEELYQLLLVKVQKSTSFGE
jgi:hypothetical protein